ncbi:MAG: hypothetical protein AB9891_17810 [Anaerolineaceae bacterium]
MPASMAPAPIPATMPSRRIIHQAGDQGVTQQSQAGHQAARRQQPADAQLCHGLSAEETGDQIAARGGRQQQSQAVERQGEFPPNRRPGHSQQPVRQP